MPSYNIRGVTVQFPYDAYQCQLIYMEKVIESLQEKKNALLESPTGTGKTLCLLCATLAWRAHQKRILFEKAKEGALAEFPGSTGFNDYEVFDGGIMDAPPAKRMAREQSTDRGDGEELPQIIYASRTHSQLKQVLRELAKTEYRDGVKTCILGSRAQLCVNNAVRALKGNSLNRACRNQVTQRKCVPHGNVGNFKGTWPEVDDVEDFVRWGEDNHCCPYFLAKEQQGSADVVFMPYNYILDPLIRKSLTFGVKSTVIILDEAHNIEAVASDSASFDFTTQDISACIEECNRVADAFAMNAPSGGAAIFNALPPLQPSLDSDEPLDMLSGMLKLKETFTQLKSLLEQLQVPADGFTKDGSFIYALFQKVHISAATKDRVIDLLDRATDLLSNGTLGGMVQIHTFRTTSALSNFSEAIKKMFLDDMSVDAVAQHYRVHIQNETSNYMNGGGGHRGPRKDAAKAPVAQVRKLSFWCFNPGLAMRALAAGSVRNFILTSGTLSPLDSFAYELSLDFSVRLENPHVVNPNQIWVGSVDIATNGATLSSAYDNRSTEYEKGLGLTLSNICRIVPDGVLVFFPSYKLLEDCVRTWKEPTQGGLSIWEMIHKYKHPILEPRESSMLGVAMTEYYACIKNGLDQLSKSAVFFAVCRGKVSEGLDFADANGRAVVIVGLPFPQAKDPKINLKKEYMDLMKRTRQQTPGAPQAISGGDWYKQAAWRAVNQAVGRVIRHRLDFGAVFLADERFSSAAEANLSRWMRPHISKFRESGKAFRALTQFFKYMKENPPHVPETKRTLISGLSGNLSIHDSIIVKNESRESVLDALDRPAVQWPKKPAFTTPFVKKDLNNTPATTSTAITISPKVVDLSEEDRARKTRKMEIRAQRFLASAKSMLSKEEYYEFRVHMRAYREKKISKDELSQRVIKIFGALPARTQLRKDFGAFLPEEYQQSYKQLLREAEEMYLAEEKERQKLAAATVASAAEIASHNSQKSNSPVVLMLSVSDSPDVEIIMDGGMTSGQSNITSSFNSVVTFKCSDPLAISTTDVEVVKEVEFVSLSPDNDSEKREKRVEMTAPQRKRSANAIVSASESDDDSAVDILDSDKTSPQPNGEGEDWIRQMKRKRATPPQDSPSAAKLKRQPTVNLITGQLDFSVGIPSISRRRSTGSQDDPASQSAASPVALTATRSTPDVFEVAPPDESAVGSCPVCRGPAQKAAAALCGHICCSGCWDSWLLRKLECPVCRQRVRPKQLVRLYNTVL